MRCADLVQHAQQPDGRGSNHWLAAQSTRSQTQFNFPGQGHAARAPFSGATRDAATIPPTLAQSAHGERGYVARLRGQRTGQAR
jgi:hypothetical protein